MKKTLRIVIKDDGYWEVSDLEATESAELKDLRAKMNTLEIDLRIARTRYREAENYAADKASLRSSLREAQEELRKLRATTTPPSARIAELEGQLEERKSALDQLSITNHVLVDNINAITPERDRLRKALYESNVQVRQLQSERADAKMKCGTAEEQRDEARKVAATLANAFRHVSASGLCLILTLEQLQAKAKADEWR